MERIKNIFNDNEIKAACLAALEEQGELERALELIYTKGFEDSITVPESEKLFSARLMEMQREYSAQLAAYGENPRSWLEKQLELTAESGMNVDMLCSALCRVAAEEHGDKWQKQEMENLLSIRSRSKHSDEENLRLAGSFASVPLEGIFGRRPLARRLSRESGEALTAIVAMALYVKIKTAPESHIPADMSFDAVCLWCRAAVEAQFMYQREENEDKLREELSGGAMVGAVMSCQYMGVNTWKVMGLCAAALLMLGYLLEKLLRLIQNELPLERLEQATGLKEVESREYDLDKGLIARLKTEHREREAREQEWMQQELQKILHRKADDAERQQSEEKA